MVYVESITAKNETRTIRDLNGQQMLATIEASTTASKAYAVGDYLIINDKVYKVTVAIASGGTITVGTNVTETKVGAELTELNRQINQFTITKQRDLEQGSYDRNGDTVINTTRVRTVGFIPVKNGDVILFTPGTITSNIFYGKFDTNKGFIGDGPGWSDSNININWDGYVILLFKNATNTTFTPSDYDAIVNIVPYIWDKISVIESATTKTPLVRNGSAGNPSNQNAISVNDIIPVGENKSVLVQANFALPIGYRYRWSFTAYTIDNGDPKLPATNQYIITSRDPIAYTSTPYYILNLPEGTKGFVVWLYASKLDDNGVYYPLRIADYGTHCISLAPYDGIILDNRRNTNIEVLSKNDNARHISGAGSNALTILHFSDIHRDADALNRIVNDAKSFGASIDDMICTGDIVGDVGGSISDWWNESILTCVGNHDSATRDGNTYNWTGISMDERDSYYIAPFSPNANYLTPLPADTKIINGVQFTSDGNGTYTINGTSTATANYDVTLGSPIIMPQSAILHLRNLSANANCLIAFFDASSQLGYVSLNAVNRICDLSSVVGGKQITKIRIGIYGANTADNVSFSPMLISNNWGIVHNDGYSYYYKDYQKIAVRLIVMDAMLYTNGGAEATAQTSWLEGLLSDAITKNRHVLIAIHAPHGGAIARDCSFSRYKQTAMPTFADCNTPQVVVDAVSSAVANGLHFIGYIVGHTHQDNIWDAEDDGKQLMYCITCANVYQQAQWTHSDQFRSASLDAYNLISIDTSNTLVKIVRGGGADIDDHMRTRKGICFNYSTGEIVGEVL